MTTEPKNGKREEPCPFSACPRIWALETKAVPCTKYLQSSHWAATFPFNSRLVGPPPSTMPSQPCPQDGHPAQDTWAGAGGLTCRCNAVGTQSQEQEASYNSYGAFHVLYSRGGCSVLQAGMQEEKGWGQLAQFFAEHPDFSLPFIRKLGGNTH